MMKKNGFRFFRPNQCIYVGKKSTFQILFLKSPYYDGNKNS